MAKSKPKPNSEKPITDNDASSRRAVADALIKVFRKQVALMASRLEDPNHVVSPGDLVGTLRVMELVDSFETRLNALFNKLKEARTELEALNDAMFAAVSKVPGSSKDDQDDPLKGL